jgi:hypothetical protein
LPLTEVKKILKARPNHLRDSEKEVLNYDTVLEMLNEHLAKNKGGLSYEQFKNSVI